MRCLFLLIGLWMPFFTTASLLPEGAWESKNGKETIIILCKNGYFIQTHYAGTTFLKSWGGVLKADKNAQGCLIEFDSSDSNRIGIEARIESSPEGSKMKINTDGNSHYFSLINNSPNALEGVWKIKARKLADGTIHPVPTTGGRKTLKMLVGGRFQWFAINTDTKQFSGTGGGIYTFENGKYTENILFFSRDNTRVGGHLSFDAKVADTQWHHSGWSSKGDPIYEVWERGPGKVIVSQVNL